ncbi:MAG: monovalent cation/H+ antiporter complex subunit F [Granulosicoccus sp.]
MFAAAAIAILVTIALGIWRALIGPTLFDRLLAVNSIGTKIVMLIAVYGFLTGRPDFLDIAMVYALFNFLGTIAVLKLFEFDDAGSSAYQEDDF